MEIKLPDPKKILHHYIKNTLDEISKLGVLKPEMKADVILLAMKEYGKQVRDFTLKLTYSSVEPNEKAGESILKLKNDERLKI